KPGQGRTNDRRPIGHASGIQTRRGYGLEPKAQAGAALVKELHLGIEQVIANAARFGPPAVIIVRVIHAHRYLERPGASGGAAASRRSLIGIVSRRVVAINADGFAEKTGWHVEQVQALNPARRRGGRGGEVPSR